MTNETPTPKITAGEHVVAAPAPADPARKTRCPACGAVVAITPNGNVRKHDGVANVRTGDPITCSASGTPAP